MIRYDPQDGSPQYLEDLATGYWLAQVLFTAVEMEIFTLLEPAGASAEDAAGALGVDRRALERFLETLCALGLVGRLSEGGFLIVHEYCPCHRHKK